MPILNQKNQKRKTEKRKTRKNSHGKASVINFTFASEF